LTPLAAMLLLGAGALALVPATARAQVQGAAQHDYDLPAGPLAATLNRIARDAGLTIVVDGRLVAGRTAPAVRGRMTAAEALRRALDGSGLVLSVDGHAAVVRAPAESGAAPQTLPEVRVVAGADPVPYSAPTATSATRIDAPLRDIPQTVNVVTRALIEDQAAHSLQDTLQNVPGVSFHIGDGQRDQVYIRGFDAIGDQYVDGLRDDGLYYRDLSNVERIEVVKGPAAVLYGRGSSGGIVNRITKKPGPWYARWNSPSDPGMKSVLPSTWVGHSVARGLPPRRRGGTLRQLSRRGLSRAREHRAVARLQAHARHPPAHSGGTPAR